MTPAKRDQIIEDALNMGFHDLPSPADRASMSPERLAILLSERKKDSPAYILVSHELNLRIAEVQARATTNASYLGIVGALLGAILGAAGTVILTSWLQNHQVKDGEKNDENKTTQPESKANSDSASKINSSVNTPAGKPLEMSRIQPPQQPAQTTKPSAKN